MKIVPAITKQNNQVLVPHTYNPGYLEVRDQEDCSLKPFQANSSRDPIWKCLTQEWAGGAPAWQVLSSNSSTAKREKRNINYYGIIRHFLRFIG
jgi:hypothetical protein